MAELAGVDSGDLHTGRRRRSERCRKERARWRGEARPGGNGAGFGQQRRMASGSGGVRLRTTAVTRCSDTAGREARSGGSDHCCRDGARRVAPGG
jgi:hypothetical protein